MTTLLCGIVIMLIASWLIHCDGRMKGRSERVDDLIKKDRQLNDYRERIKVLESTPRRVKTYSNQKHNGYTKHTEKRVQIIGGNKNKTTNLDSL